MTSITWKDNQLGGMIYPYLHGRRWGIDTLPLRMHREIDAIAQTASLMWAKDDKLVALRVKNDAGDLMTQAELLAELGLEIELQGSVLKTSKRISRVMRPFFAAGHFEADSIHVHFDDTLDAKTWDGVVRISRRLLKRLAQQLDHVPTDKRPRIVYELKHDQRFEITLLGPYGQIKGHAVVDEQMTYDVHLPTGEAKTEIRTTNGKAMLGVAPVHGADRMWLDVQSLMHFHLFLTNDVLTDAMHHNAELFFQSLENGDRAAMLANTTFKDNGWLLQEYLACGGDPYWFTSVMKSLAHEYSTMLDKRALEKMRMPVHGGRYYVLVDEVAHRTVKPSHAVIDPALGSALVSKHDWPAWSAIWGGADQDDALWVVPFTDFDNVQKLLLWRSPNALGEYVVATVGEGSHTLQWGDWTYPQMDSRTLPPRIDQQQYTYLLKDGNSPKVTGDYTVQKVVETGRLMERNSGVLGTYVNFLMVHYAVYGKYPDTLPAPLEYVIDSTIKTGDDLSSVRAWCKNAAMHMAHDAIQVPGIIKPRLTNMLPEAYRGLVQDTLNHWLDELYADVQLHMHDWKLRIRQLCEQCIPPVLVLNKGLENLNTGIPLANRYADTFKANIGNDVIVQPEVYGAVAKSCWELLEPLSEIERMRAVLGAIAHRHLNSGHVFISDQVAFQQKHNDESGHVPSIGMITLSALRKLGLLKTPVMTDDGWTYVDPVPAGDATRFERVIVLDAWWAFGQRTCPELAGITNPILVPPALRKHIRKEMLKRIENGSYIGKPIENRDGELYTDGKWLGTLKAPMRYPQGVIQHAFEHHGSLVLLYR